MENYTPTTARDPVCGMNVDPASTRLVSSHKGRTYYFCAEGCQKTFESNPDKHVKSKGFFSRFLDRLGKSNKKQFGSKGPSCCN